MNPIRHLIQRSIDPKARHLFLKSDAGSVVTELALILPVFLIILAGVIEMGYYLHLNLKLQHTAVSVADLVTRDDELSENTIADIFTAVPRILTPYADRNRYQAVVTHIHRNLNDTARTSWQRIDGNFQGTSSFPAESGQTVSLPRPITLRERESIVVTEIFFRYEPLIFPVLDQRVVRKVSVYRPRLGSLQEILSN